MSIADSLDEMSSNDSWYDRREKYRSSGRIAFFRLIVGLVVLLPAMVALGLGLYVSCNLRPKLAWFGVAMTFTGYAATIFFAAKLSHLRSSWLALLIGAFAGILLILARYHFDLVWQGGEKYLWRLDLTPTAVWNSLNNGAAAHNLPNQNGQLIIGDAPHVVELAFNWIWFCGIALVFAITGASCWLSVASTPYCERCGKWMSERTIYTQSGVATLIGLGLRTGDFQSLEPFEPSPANEMNQSEIKFYSCFHGNPNIPGDVYLEATEKIRLDENTQDQSVFPPIRLTTDELVELAARCPTAFGIG